MDDFVLFDDDTDVLLSWLKKIKEFLGNKLNLEVHENKSRIYRVDADSPFLGFVFSKDQIRIRHNSIVRFKRRMQKYAEGLKNGSQSWQKIHQSVQSWIGHVKHADTYPLRKLVLGDIVFQSRGEEGSML